jgi:hypothetical protein
MADEERANSAEIGEIGAVRAPGEEVVLPEHASAYCSPRLPPAVTAHSTIETASVRLDPAIDPTLAVTERLNVDGLEPPPWLVSGARSDAPTVLLPIVRARRRGRRLIAALTATGIGAAIGVAVGLTRGPDDEPARAPTSLRIAAEAIRSSAAPSSAAPSSEAPSSAAPSSAAPSSAAPSSAAPSSAAPSGEAPSGEAPSGEAPSGGAPAGSGPLVVRRAPRAQVSLQPARDRAPARVQGRSVSSGGSAWFKSEREKVWVP